jgi:HSP20 family molecular chaperone IbpA
MFLTRRDPFIQLDRLVDDFWHPWPELHREPCFDNKLVNPVRRETASDGSETVQFDVPGLDKEDIKLRYDSDILSVQSESKKKSDEGTSTRFISYKIYVPGLDVSSFEATCDKGVLTVTAKPLVPNQVSIEIK